jgi:hypothetical protein
VRELFEGIGRSVAQGLVKVIRTEQHHHTYQKEVQDLVTKASPSKVESERLELLTDAEAYPENFAGAPGSTMIRS